MPRIILVLFLLFTGQHTAVAQLSNQLANHASPYLAMHGQDPVQWQEWNAKTVSRAKKAGKLLFVSSGYFSCHWCHVMQRESYQNKTIAAILNKYFIPVKVDREIHAALDAKLIDFVQHTQGIAGWPLNVFVTPDGYPLVGMVYVPPDNFQQVVSRLSEQWQQKRQELENIARRASEELSKVSMATDGNLPAGLGRNLEDKVINQAFSLADEMQGGFGDQNKFPSVPQLQVLLDSYPRNKNSRLKKFLLLTLDQMASQGLRDHLGGGFFRYSVDPGWQIPHFEKMLYDNALLAELYLTAAQVLAKPDYENIGRETLDFILREMATEQGSFAASLSAVDNQGVEGGYYLWEQNELKSLLNKDELAVANLVWQLEGPADIEHGHHLILATEIPLAAQLLKMDIKEVKRHLASARDKLSKARLKRIVPKDSKRIASWNGLLLSALTKGAHLKDGERYRKAAHRLQRELISLFWNGQQLFRTASEKNVFGQAGLEDYAYVARGLFDWAQLSGSKTDWDNVSAIVQQAWQRFYTPHGWKLAQNMLLRYGVGQAVIADGPMPSPVAVLIDVTLASQGSAPQLKQRALQALNSGHSELLEDSFWYATQVGMMVRHQIRP